MFNNIIENIFNLNAVSKSCENKLASLKNKSGSDPLLKARNYLKEKECDKQNEQKQLLSVEQLVNEKIKAGSDPRFDEF